MVAAGGKKDVDNAVQAAKTALYTSWGTKTPGSERGRLLNKLADLIEQNLDELAAIEALDCGNGQLRPSRGHSLILSTGKLISLVKVVDFRIAIETFRYYAGWADKHFGRTIEVRSMFLRRQSMIEPPSSIDR